MTKMNFLDIPSQHCAEKKKTCHKTIENYAAQTKKAIHGTYMGYSMARLINSSKITRRNAASFFEKPE